MRNSYQSVNLLWHSFIVDTERRVCLKGLARGLKNAGAGGVGLV